MPSAYRPDPQLGGIEAARFQQAWVLATRENPTRENPPQQPYWGSPLTRRQLRRLARERAAAAAAAANAAWDAAVTGSDTFGTVFMYGNVLVWSEGWRDKTSAVRSEDHRAGRDSLLLWAKNAYIAIAFDMKGHGVGFGPTRDVAKTEAGVDCDRRGGSDGIDRGAANGPRFTCFHTDGRPAVYGEVSERLDSFLAARNAEVDGAVLLPPPYPL